MHQRKLERLNEESLFNLIKEKLIPDLAKSGHRSYVDCYSIEANLVIELKCRRMRFDTLMIEKIKYEKLISSDFGNVRYINSNPYGIFSFDIRTINKPEWITKDCKKTTDLEVNEYVPKVVGFLNLTEGKNITEILLGNGKV